MGTSNSKPNNSSIISNSTALKLCKERRRFIKQAMDSRYALAAAHVSYIQSLRNVGVALRRYAEAEVLVENSLSASATEVDRTPSHSSLPSPSQPHLGGAGVGVQDSPVLNGSPLSPSKARVSYMKSSGASALTVRVSPPPRNLYVEEGKFSMPPPPPPLPEMGSSWDYFDPADESFRFMGKSASSPSLENGNEGFVHHSNGDDGDEEEEEEEEGGGGFMTPRLDPSRNGRDNTDPTSVENSRKNGSFQRGEDEIKAEEPSNSQSTSKKPKSPKNGGAKEVPALRDDPSEFITHRAKDFLSSMKDIDGRFFRASESGKEVAGMLESNKIHVGYANASGSSSASVYLSSFGGACCQGGATNIADDQHATKVITWKRTTSSRSSSSKNPLTAKDENDDGGSDFVEEFSMISGSHSSTLDRLYAWERKLHDEVKASESIQKHYDRKCEQLRHQFAKDMSPQTIDKTRAVAKDLHSRMRVALHAVDSISKRIEKMRDDEMLPQILELINGLTRMWKAMLECHHTQYITISLAYHSKASSIAPFGETQRQIISQLQDEVEYFGLSFADWINSYTKYVESINGWLQNCILHPKERQKGRRAFSPRRYLAPPIFVLLRDWSLGIKSLPSQEVSDSIREFLSDLRQHSAVRNTRADESTEELSAVGEEGDCVKGSLTKVLDRLTKFSEASVKMYEDVRQKCDSAKNAYDNYRQPPRAFSI